MNSLYQVILTTITGEVAGVSLLVLDVGVIFVCTILLVCLDFFVFSSGKESDELLSCITLLSFLEKKTFIYCCILSFLEKDNKPVHMT